MGHTLLILWNISRKISMSVRFKTPIMGNRVRYAIQKIVPPKIRFRMLLNGEATRKASENRAHVPEVRYILVEEERSRLTLIFLTAVNNR